MASDVDIAPASSPAGLAVQQRLLGSWHLVRWVITYDDGRAPSYPFGEQAGGLIVYTPQGHMSACIAQADRAPLSSASVRSAPPQEQCEAFGSYFHYAGPYAVVAESRSPSGWQVHHHVHFALNPNFRGSVQRRNLVFTEDGELHLSASDAVPGSTVQRLHQLVWRRAQ